VKYPIEVQGAKEWKLAQSTLKILACGWGTLIGANARAGATRGAMELGNYGIAMKDVADHRHYYFLSLRCSLQGREQNPFSIGSTGVYPDDPLESKAT
jgi:hypothetical protein